MKASFKLSRPGAEVFVPDGTPMPEALARTTHLCVGAHQDDQEVMAYHGVSECFQRPGKWFTGVCVTSGSGSPRSGAYRRCSDEEMSLVRQGEQRKAAIVGGYACEIQLMYPSAFIKDPANAAPEQDLLAILRVARPDVVYLHNPADKHDTHVACSLRAIAALRALPARSRPARVYGCEVWRSLDWLNDADKKALPSDRHPNLAAALLEVFDSQVAGGKRYDAATIGRRTANATFFESHATDKTGALTWAVDLTPLVRNPALCVADYMLGFVDRFRRDVEERIGKMAGRGA